MKKAEYNQIANYAYMQTEINIQVGNKSPNIYLAAYKENGNGYKKYGGITDFNSLLMNLKENSIPKRTS